MGIARGLLPERLVGEEQATISRKHFLVFVEAKTSLVGQRSRM